MFWGLKCDGVEGQVINIPGKIKDAFTNSFILTKTLHFYLFLIISPHSKKVYPQIIYEWLIKKIKLNNPYHHYIFSVVKTSQRKK